jgi:two-component system sensor histidine kinase NreB
VRHVFPETDYKNALDQSSIVSITDGKGVIKYVNENFCKISGYSAGELMGLDHRIINPDYHPDSYTENLWKMISKGKIWRGEFCNKSKNGSLYWVDATIIPFLNSKGKPVQYLAITNDITEKKLMEKKIIDQKVQEQKTIARAIIQAQEKERNHIGRELHDNINQILATAKMFLSVASKNHEETKKLIQYPLELIDNSIEEIRVLSHELVTIIKDIDLQIMIRNLLNNFSQHTTVKTNFTYLESGGSISDDLKLNIYRIIQEQLNNIAKHACAQKVSVSVRVDKNSIDVTVADDGIGFNVNKKRKGIGISNMKNRVQSYNGKVEIVSSPGNGCIINIEVPERTVSS